MNKRILLFAGVGLVVVLLGVGLFFYFSRTGKKDSAQTATTGNTSQSQSSQASGVTPISQALYDQLVADLGVASSQDQPNFQTDKAVATASLSSAKAYNSILSTYRVLPEQLVTLKSEVASGKTEIPALVKVNFGDLTLAPSITDGVTKQGDAIAQSSGVPVFTLETSFTENYYKTLAKGFGLTNPTILKDSATGQVSISQAGSADGKSIEFNPASGAFSFETKGAYTKTATLTSAEAVQTAQNYIYNNPALSGYARNVDTGETTTYEKKDTPGVVYVVFHRGWIPLPILNSRYVYGLDKLEGTIRDTVKANHGETDRNIYNTSDQVDGYARSESFNTIVVGVAKEGIANVVGNMRPQKQDVAAVNLVSAKQAFEQAAAGSYYKISLNPRTEPDIDFSKYAENGVLKLTDGEINAIYLAYNEEPLNLQMNYLQPVYIMRGTAKVGGNEAVFSFITQAIVPSEVKVSSMLDVSASDLVGGYIGQSEDWSKSGQGGTGIGAWKPSATYISGGTSSTATTGKRGTSPWIPGLVYGGGEPPTRSSHRYMSYCPVISLYSSAPQSFTIRPKAEGTITYAYPALSQESWSVLTNKTGSLGLNGKDYENLYYEFDSDAIPTPAEGYVVAREQATDFLENNLLPKLGLTQSEIATYLLDINYHIFNETKPASKYYKISLLSKSQIENILPLEVMPSPQSKIRNFLVFEELQSRPNQKVREPEISAIDRSSESLLVENGCMLK